jgi:hypothetical protein
MYRYTTAKKTASPLQSSDGMILIIGPLLKGHSVTFPAIQTHLSSRFFLAVNSLGLRRSGSSSQIIIRRIGTVIRADHFHPGMDATAFF